MDGINLSLARGKMEEQPAALERVTLSRWLRINKIIRFDRKNFQSREKHGKEKLIKKEERKRVSFDLGEVKKQGRDVLDSPSSQAG